MLRLALVFSLLFAALEAQVVEQQTLFTTQTGDRSVTVTVGGQTFGPYQSVEGTPAFSPDSRHWVLAARNSGPGNAYTVLVDGREAAALDQSNGLSDLSITDDGKTWSLVSGLSTASRQNAVRITNGKTSEPLGNIGPLSWSPDGKNSYYLADNDKGRVVVLNGKVLGPFQNPQFPAWDVAGSQLAFTFSGNGGAWVWLAGKQAGPFAQAQLITRNDGAWLGYSATDKNNKTSLYLGGKAYGPYDWVDPNLDWKNAQGTQWMTRVYKKGVSYLVDDGKETRYDSLDFYALPGGSYVARWGGFANWRLNIGGTLLGPWDGPEGPLVFDDGSEWAVGFGSLPNNATEKFYVRLRYGQTHEGRHLRLLSEDQGQAFTWYTDDRSGPLLFQRYDKNGPSATTLVSAEPSPPDGIVLKAGGNSYGPYTELVQWAATPNGQHWGALVRLTGNRYQVVIDGRESAPTQPLDRAAEFQLSDNGASWSLRGWPTKSSDAQVRLVNGVSAGPFQSPWPVQFSADGTHYAYWSQALKGNQKQLTFDGKLYGPYAKDQTQHLYDLEAGHFVFGLPDKGGTLVVTEQGTFGPFQDWRLLPRGPLARDSETGPLFGFTGRKNDGTTMLYVVPGLPGGGASYGPYQNVPGTGTATVSSDGKDWYFTAQKVGSPNQTLLHNGVAAEVRGAEAQRLPSGILKLRVWEEAQETLSLGGVSLGSWTHVNQWLVSDDGKNWAAEVQQGDGPQSQQLVVVNGVSGPGTGLKFLRSGGVQAFQWVSQGAEGGVRHTVTLKGTEQP